MNVISVGSWFSPFAYSNSRWCSTTSHHTFHLPSIGLPSPFTGSRFGFLLKQGNSRGLFLGQSSTLSSGDILDFRQMELISESDFEQIVSPDGTLSICGFGSLLSERSARSTFPDLINFRVAKLNGFRRVFAHVAPIFFERGIAKPETKEISSLSVEPCEGESLIVTVFEIKKSEIPSFIEREHEFRFLAVLPETLEGIPYVNPAVLCARYSDEEYFQNRCNDSSSQSPDIICHTQPTSSKPNGVEGVYFSSTLEFSSQNSEIILSSNSKKSNNNPKKLISTPKPGETKQNHIQANLIQVKKLLEKNLKVQ